MHPLKICCITNSRAGPSGEPFGNVVAELFAAHGVQLTIFELHEGNSLRGLAEDAVHQSYDVIVAAGGDGTINAVASVLVGHNIVKLGIIPRGTLNHFARALEIPTDMEKAVETIVAGHVKMIDVGQVNDQIFVNNSSVGLYPSIVRMRESLQNLGSANGPPQFGHRFVYFQDFAVSH